jgi:hypothetical protein
MGDRAQLAVAQPNAGLGDSRNALTIFEIIPLRPSSRSRLHQAIFTKAFSQSHFHGAVFTEPSSLYRRPLISGNPRDRRHRYLYSPS